MSHETMQSVNQMKHQLQQLIEMKSRGPLFDYFKNQKGIVKDLRKFKPHEWNNIPIPIADMLSKLIGYCRVIAKIDVEIN